MFDRFTELARKTMGYARREAQRFHHAYLGTEHMLLGIAQVGPCTATSMLHRSDIDPGRVRREVELIIKAGPAIEPPIQIPFTPRAKRVIELCLEEAVGLGHDYIGTEHLLLGLVREREGIAAHVLAALGADIQQLRIDAVDLLDANDEETTG